MEALEGLKVVDLSLTQVGAQASQVLADFGADVVWVEPPGGAPLRGQASFPLVCRGKRSVVLDLHDAGAAAQARDLIAGADVVVESFRPGVADRLGLGYDALAATNPGLVYASISGWGSNSAYAGAPGYEGLVQAKLGVFQLFTGLHNDDRPPFVAMPWCSFPASQLAAQGILAALLERGRSGLGQHVETSLVQGFAALDTWNWFIHLVNERYPDAYPSATAYGKDGIPSSPFPLMLLVALTKDGRWLQFAQVAPHLFLALIKALGMDDDYGDLMKVASLNTPEQILEFWDRALTSANQRTLAEWQTIFDEDPNVFAELYRNGPEVLEHPQLVASGDVLEIDDPVRGKVTEPAALVKMEATPGTVERIAPALGDTNAAGVGWVAKAAGPTGAGGDGNGPALEGLTVIEMAVQYAAPFGATLLADMGARVIKVETLAGDPIRTMVPFPEAGGAKVMQGKECIAVDIQQSEGVAIVRQLAERADLVLQGFRAGVADRLGVGAEALRSVNPDLVYLHASGYGPLPPNGHRPSFAPSIGAAAGIARLNVGTSVPERPGLSLEEIRPNARRLMGSAAVLPAQADGLAAVGVATSLLLGVLARSKGAGGQTLISSMLAINSHALANEVVDFEGAVHQPKADAGLWGLNARYRVYEASDGWVFLAVPQAHEWPLLVGALAEHVDLGGDARFSTEDDRVRNDGALAETLAKVFAGRAKDDWERDLLAADVGCVAVTTGPVESVLQGDSFGYEHGFIVDVEHPTFGEHPRLGPLVRFSRSVAQMKPGELNGQSTDAVLAELGYSPDQISDLRARKIVG